MSPVSAGSPKAATGGRSHVTAWRWAFAVAVVVQLLALYAPSAPAPPSGLPLDKVVHVGVFAAVAWTGIRAGLPVRWVVGVLLAQSVVSELVQHFWLPHRSGDWRDAAADAVGTLVAAAWAVRTAGPRQVGTGA